MLRHRRLLTPQSLQKTPAKISKPFFMKRNLISFFVTTLAFASMSNAADDPKRAANTVVLDETGVKNLRIETVEVEENDFETTVFALGRIQTIPAKVAALSSRISGRIVELRVAPADEVKAGDEIVKVESRQPGDPPPTISLKAPIAGMITRLDLRLGDPVEPDKSILEITDLKEVYAVARVPEHQAGRMKPGTIAHIKVAALPDQKFDGELLRFGTSADKQSGTIDAIFRLPNNESLLRSDMRAEFSIVLNKRSNVVSVPRAALQGEGGNRFVYVKDFDLANAFIKTLVTVGEINDRYVEIVSGLFPADEVVTRGAYSLSFAGASSVSLKEALDAAHGHEHAADGSEMTPEKKAENTAKSGGANGDQGIEGVHVIWMYATFAVSLLLIVAIVAQRGSRKEQIENADEASGKEGE